MPIANLTTGTSQAMKYNFTKVMRIGTIEGMNIFVKAEYKDGKLSLTGVENPRRGGDADGGAGQIVMSYKEYDEHGHYSIADIVPAPGWGASTIKALFDIWDKWHLNDMQAGCEHQRKAWNPSKKITVTPLHPTHKYWSESKRAENGEMSAEEYSIWGDIVKVCDSAWLHNKTRVYSRELWTPEIHAAVKLGYLEIDAEHVETKGAGWVYPTEHPEGLLTKACPTCGYKYGTKWLKMEIPTAVHARLTRFPDADKAPAWI